MRLFSKIFVALVLLALVSSCSETPTQVSAEQMTIQDLSTTPGFTWFNYEFESYQPNASIIEEIKTKYQPNEHSFVIFAKANCSCPGKHSQTPEFVKSLFEAGIPLDKCEIYSVTSKKNHHPYEGMIEIKELPQIVVMKNGSAVYSVSETINSLNEENPNAGMTVEQSLLLGLDK